MKVLAYYPLHYGAEYLKESIISILPCTTKIVFLYTEEPSYGHHTHLKNPETKEQLKAIVDNTIKGQCAYEWVDVSVKGEGNHRNIAFKYADGFDIVLAVDADEIWNTEDLRVALEECKNSKWFAHKISGFINFWRSFKWEVKDFFEPYRLFNVKGVNDQQGTIKARVYHLGYAQSKAITEYKLAIHGHKSEIAGNWYKDKFCAWETNKDLEKLHPASQDVWLKAEPFDDKELPILLKMHPNYNKEIIE